MQRILLTIAAVLVLSAEFSPAATVLYCPMDSLREWSVRSVGATGAKVVDRSGGSRCVEVTSSRGTVFLSRELPIEAVRDGRLTVTCSVKPDRVVRGPQLLSTAKLHLAVETPRGIRHHSARFTGTADWHRESFSADIPADARRVLLNLGMEACFGRVLFDRLLVRNDRRGVRTLDLSTAVNADHGQLKLAAFPKETVECNGIPFRIINATGHDGLDCLRLRGVDHPDWPATTASPIAVNSVASEIYILHATLADSGTDETPCAMWIATFVGGLDTSLSVFEGRDIGSIAETKNLENWQVAWTGHDAADKRVTFGVTKWTTYSDAPIESLSFQAYQGAAPVVLAVTVVEELPPPEPDPDETDEGDGFQ